MPASQTPSRTEQFRSAIRHFIDERKETKLKGKDDPEVAARYEYGVWIESAAERIRQIQAVTHVAKATHPDSRASNPMVRPTRFSGRVGVGSHCLQAVEPDVVGNAAALDVYKFLSIVVDGHPLFHWAETGDADLAAALHTDPAAGMQRLQAFRNLSATQDAAQTDQFGKQVYWLTVPDAADDSSFHLVQPLFSSPLMQAIHQDIQNARFGEANKLARQVWRDRKASDATYIEYRDLAQRKLGGTKPQNISQQNSERHGTNYLLSTAPPQWKSPTIPMLRKDADLWRAFHYFRSVRSLLDELAAFLLTNPPPNRHTRNRRDGLVQAIGAWLPEFMEVVRAILKPGWTQEEECELTSCLKLWLEPSFDPVAYDWGDWPDQVASLFSLWLISQLRERKIIGLGDPEYLYLARQAVIEAAWPVPMQRRAAPIEMEEPA